MLFSMEGHCNTHTHIIKMFIFIGTVADFMKYTDRLFESSWIVVFRAFYKPTVQLSYSIDQTSAFLI